MNCPSQRGARTLTFFIPGFNTTVASLELWEGEGLKPREWRLRPQIVSQKFYNSLVPDLGLFGFVHSR